MNEQNTTTELVKFVLGFQGLNTSIDYIMTAEEWQGAAAADDLTPNTNWTHVTVASKEDRDAYIDAQTEWLRAAWTSNQSIEEREYSQVLMNEAEAKMDSLQICEWCKQKRNACTCGKS